MLGKLIWFSNVQEMEKHHLNLLKIMHIFLKNKIHSGIQITITSCYNLNVYLKINMHNN